MFLRRKHSAVAKMYAAVWTTDCPAKQAEALDGPFKDVKGAAAATGAASTGYPLARHRLQTHRPWADSLLYGDPLRCAPLCVTFSESEAMFVLAIDCYCQQSDSQLTRACREINRSPTNW
jgi:hypothetical protein